MSKESILYGVIGLLIGVVVISFTTAYSANNNHENMMNMMEMHTNTSHEKAADHDSMSMADMTEQLKNKTGDDFDKAFVEMMIAHHQGAIDMAKLIPDRAKHDELKRLGEAIISTQTEEIEDMKQWQKDWGYTANEMMRMMHGE